MIRAAIVGGTGYTGVELLRILTRHPHVELAAITSRSERGRPVAALFPNLRHHLDLAFSDPEQAPLDQCDVVFFATPNGTAMTQVPALLAAGVRVVDLAADFRLKDPEIWSEWYKIPHACPELLAEAVYGLPELHRDAIRQARLVANPGCYATAVTLGFLPLVEANLVDDQHLVADGKSGVSGAGRNPAQHLLLGETSENFAAYAAAGHRHLPEICQTLTKATGRPIKLTFVPHLVPMVRGIHATLYAPLQAGAQTALGDLHSLFVERYRREPCVDVLPLNSHPDTRSVRGVNLCRLAVHLPMGSDTIVLLSVIDNLVKGAAGQAIQNMNLMFGIEETAGLEDIALLP